MIFGLGHSDEAMLRDPNHPAHTSGREGMWLAVLIWLCGIIFFVIVDVPWLSLTVKIFLVLSVGTALGFMVGNWFSKLKLRSKLKYQEEYRTAQEIETKRQITEMKNKEKHNAE